MKNNIRIAILNKRKALNKDFVDNCQNIFFSKLFDIVDIDRYNTFFVYLDFQNEVKTKKIITFLLDQKKSVLVPLINTKNHSMKAIEIKSFNDLQLGHFGILEPVDKPCTLTPDVVIVPGVAFDINGNRIGFGKGYYDVYFSSLKSEPLKVALAYDFQVLDTIPAEPHDVKMDYILTEKRTIIV